MPARATFPPEAISYLKTVHGLTAPFNVNTARGTIDIGCDYNGWLLFYKVPNVNTN